METIGICTFDSTINELCISLLRVFKGESYRDEDRKLFILYIDVHA